MVGLVEGERIATGGVLTVGKFSTQVGNTGDTYTWDYTTTDSPIGGDSIETTGGRIEVNNTFEFEGVFEMTPEQVETFKEIMMGQPVEVKKRVIPKHRLIRED